MSRPKQKPERRRGLTLKSLRVALRQLKAERDGGGIDWARLTWLRGEG